MHSLTDNTNEDTRFQQCLQRWSAWFALVPVFVGVLVLVGWAFHISILTSPLSDQIAMNPVTAVTLLLSAFSLLILSGRGKHEWKRKLAGRLLAIIIIGIGLWKLFETMGIVSSGIDRLLFQAQMAADTRQGRLTGMSPNTAFSFILTGIAFLLLHLQTRRGHMPSQYLALLIGLLSFFTIVGYLYGVKAFDDILEYIPMAIHTAISFLLITLAIFFSSPDRGMMKTFTSLYAGGIIARYLIPMAVIVPVILGLLRLYGYWVGAFTTEFGVAILVLSIIVFFLGLIWYTVRLLNTRDAGKAKAEQKLKQFSDVLEQQVLKRTGELRLLTSLLVDVREQERIRISREIHDELGQQLTGLKMDMAWLSKKTGNGEEKVQRKFSMLLGLLDEMVKTVRRIASELRPAILDDFGLLSAIEWHSSEFAERFAIKVHLSMPPIELILPADTATGIFRIYQEALTNIARHAEANNVTTSLTIEGNQLTLTIADDGKGFDPQQAENKKTLGLLGMRERILAMNGQYELDSVCGKGTTISVVIPL